MKEFVEKLIERLEEKKGTYFDGLPCEGTLIKINDAIGIVKDLTSEHNNGWISVEDALPENMQKCLTTAEIYFIPDHVDEPDSYIGVELNVYSKKYGWLHNTEVIAWQPLPAPYKKGE